METFDRGTLKNWILDTRIERGRHDERHHNVNEVICYIMIQERNICNTRQDRLRLRVREA